jgi:DnaJ-class molecular chaperone
MKDYYQALGVGDNATDEQIKRAYREIAKKFHPDRNPGDKAAEERFKAASEAYETLGDKEKRAKYDRLRKLGGGAPFGGFGGGSGESMDYEEFMRRFGGPHQRDRGQKRSTGFGGDLSFEDLFGGLFGGKGRERKGAPPPATEPQPTDDPFFKRLNDDAYVDLPVNLAQLLLGSRVSVRTPGGKRITLRVRPGTDPEKALRVPGMGYQAGSKSGDLFVRLHLSIPKNLTPEQIEAAKKLAEALGLKH